MATTDPALERYYGAAYENVPEGFPATLGNGSPSDAHSQSQMDMGQYLAQNFNPYGQNFRQQGFPYGQNFGYSMNAYGQPMMQFPYGSNELSFQQNMQGQLEGMLQNGEMDLQNQHAAAAAAAAAAGFPMHLQQMSLLGMSPEEQLYATMAGLTLGQSLGPQDSRGQGMDGPQSGPQSGSKSSWVDVVGRPDGVMGYNQANMFEQLAMMGGPPPMEQHMQMQMQGPRGRGRGARGRGRGRGFGRESQFSTRPLPEPVINYHTFDGINCTEIDLDPEGARYFIIKSYSEDDIHKSIKYGLWASTEQGNRRLDQAFHETNGPIYLFYSVNASGQFCGMAQMKSQVDYNKKFAAWAQDKWKGQFEVDWLIAKDVPNGQLRHITLPNNENKPVTNSRDTQEIPEHQGRQVLRIFVEYQPTTSILDDFAYYDKRQSEMMLDDCVSLPQHHPPPPPPPVPGPPLFGNMPPGPFPGSPPGPPPFLGSPAGGGRGGGRGQGEMGGSLGRGMGGRGRGGRGGRFQGRGRLGSRPMDEIASAYAPPSGPIQVQLLPAKRAPKQKKKKGSKDSPDKDDSQRTGLDDESAPKVYTLEAIENAVLEEARAAEQETHKNDESAPTDQAGSEA